MTRRWIVVVIVALSVLWGCGGSDRGEQEKAATQLNPGKIAEMSGEAEKIVDQQMEKIQEQEAATFPCSLFPQEEIDALVGNALETGSYTFEHRSEEARDYRSESCAWSAKGAEGNEVSLWVSLAKDFDSGQVVCYPPLGAEADNPYAPKKIPGIGDQAWWDYDKSWGIGTLRVCSPSALMEVKVDLAGDDEAFARKVARAMAEKVLTSQ